MSNTNTGGPAFPRAPFTYIDNNNLDWAVREQSGMTLRDYFAAKALAAPYAHHESDPDRAAEWAYQLADAMLKAREA
jgi:hypothetical protein